MKAYSMQNKKAWEYNAYEFWVKQAGTPADRAKKRGPAALPWVIVCCGMMLTGCGEAGTEADGKSNDQVPENVSEPEETEPVQAQEDIDETSAAEGYTLRSHRNLRRICIVRIVRILMKPLRLRQKIYLNRGKPV